MDAPQELFLGIDVGTGGVRALAVTATGQVAARSSVALEVESPREDRHEQPPQAWWEAVCAACRELLSAVDASTLGAVAVDGTSGTLLAVDAAGSPLRPAIMYNDPRARAEADALNAVAGPFCRKLGYRFAASYALPKVAWLKGHEPETFNQAARFVHQADYIIGRLTGDFAASDYSNALKTGYDLLEEKWPGWIADHLVATERLPRVTAPGTPVAQVTQAAAQQTGLPEGLPVVTGATDGTAACLASGVKNLGDYNTTLGTTLVFKGVSDHICAHPDGLIYSHRLPGNRWLPGAASNTGGEWIPSLFPGEDIPALDAAAAGVLPTPHLAYPLVRKGERFPFLAADAEGFEPAEAPGKVARFAACLQGTAFVERMAYEVLDEVAGTSEGQVFSTGGGSRSDVWMQCRADVTGRVVHRPACPESAFGSAVLAAAGTYYDGVWQAVDAMVRIERSFTPDPNRTPLYDELYAQFAAEIDRRGYR